jgi:hypothetical protein
MIPHHRLLLSTAVALSAMFAGPAASQTTKAALTGPARVPFLQRLPSRFVIPSNDPRQPPFCRQLSGLARCPPILAYGGPLGLPTIDPAFKADLPNVRVTIVIQEMSNTAVANGGIDDPSASLTWATTSPAASDEEGGPYLVGLPTPGPPVFSQILIYDALVNDACESFSPFPIDHLVSIMDADGEIGAFHGVDNSTVDATGFYNIHYTIRATNAAGAVSDIHFSGKVSATCSGADSL